MTRLLVMVAGLQVLLAASSPLAARKTTPSAKDAPAAKATKTDKPNHTTPFSSADCKAATRFKGIKPAAMPCDSPAFFDGGKLPNAARNVAGWADLPTCLGIAPHINTYLEKNPNRCRRLDSAALD